MDNDLYVLVVQSTCVDVLATKMPRMDRSGSIKNVVNQRRDRTFNSNNINI